MVVVLEVDCRGSKGHGERAYIESGVKLVSAQTFQADESAWGGTRAGLAAWCSYRKISIWKL